MAYDYHHQNKAKAFEYYTKSEKYLDKLGSRYRSLKPYLYYGLSKYWTENGDNEKGKEYYKKAKEFDDNDYLKNVDKPKF